MKLAVFHGSPRKGNTYMATKIFLEELSRLGDVQCTEFFLPGDMPEFCVGCQRCLSGPPEGCPHTRYVEPVLRAILDADALLFATPHYGACSMSGGMKNLLDHLDFLTLTISPRAEVFGKKAMILTTGSGSAAAAKPIAAYLRNWGVNRVYTLGLRMFTNQWDQMPEARERRFAKRLRRAAGRLYRARRGRPYLSTVFMYYLSRFIVRRYIGEGNYPFLFWKEKGYFDRCPLSKQRYQHDAGPT